MTIRLLIDKAPIQNLILAMPKQVLAGLGRFAFGSFVDHRVAWLKQKSTRFGRGGRGIRVGRVGEGDGRKVGAREVIYQVPPRATPRTQAEARFLLNRWEAAIYTGNLILPVHEFGTDIRSSRWMALPIKPRAKGADTPARWRAKFPRRHVVIFPSRRHPGELVMRWKKRTKRGEPQRWQTIFRLTKHVDMKPTLRFYETWAQLAPKREQKWQEMTTRLWQDLVTRNVQRDMESRR